MCLIVERNNLVKSDRTTVYKVVARKGMIKRYYSPYQSANSVRMRFILNKEAVSDRENIEVGKDKRDEDIYPVWGVYRGVHVYHDLNEGLEQLSWFNTRFDNRYALLKCEVDPKDHVADGCNDDAVYMKIKPVKVQA